MNLNSVIFCLVDYQNLRVYSEPEVSLSLTFGCGIFACSLSLFVDLVIYLIFGVEVSSTLLWPLAYYLDFG